jgi:hypothetical protein
MACKHDCEKPDVFPKPIFNRPGLPRIDYRIGSYADLRERMFALVNQDPALAAWTHRGADDPGIAILEGAAVVGDILTFYQQLYANELYLRTAQWRESVVELVRLLGYRLAPGVGGEATFAMAVKGTTPVTIDKGFGLKADLDGQDKSSEFESVETVTAYPWLSQFALYKPFQDPPPALSGSANEFTLTLPGGDKPDISLSAGTRLLIGTSTDSDPKRLHHAEVVVVDSAVEEDGKLIVRIQGAIKKNVGAAHTRAYVLGESYHHFGHNAPPIYFQISGSTTTPVSTWYYRDDWEGDTNSIFYSIDFAAKQVEMPLERETKTIAPGSKIVIEATMQTIDSGWTDRRYTLVGEVASLENKTLTFGAVSGSSTVLTLEEPLLTLMNDPSSYDAFRMDIRTMTFHEVKGTPLFLHSKDDYVSASSGNALAFWGTAEQAKALIDRRLLFTYADGTEQFVQATGLAAGALVHPKRTRYRQVMLDTQIDYAQFLHDTETLVYGNLVFATQGKSQTEVVLGNGDRRQIFQTFKLPKMPLTYLLDETHTPAQVPELTVYVDGIAWTQVETFFNYGPDDAVYIVREDEDENSYVQFGDGKNGRRLSSGLGNVTAVFRVGNGAYGPLKDGATPSITGKLKEFDKLYLPTPVTVGAPREDEANARVAAPGKMQSLGRMVSLADIEAEALALPHVLKARAVWSAPEGVPLVRVTVLTASGASADADAVSDSMQTYNRCRGPARYPIDVVQGIRQYVYLHVEAGFDVARKEEDVTAAIKQALGLAGEEGDGIDGADGLFGLNRRQFGQNAHTSQIIGAVQNASGVTWVKLLGAQVLALGSPPETDPAALAKPSLDIVQPVLACTTERLLALHSLHLTLSLSKDETSSECST